VEGGWTSGSMYLRSDIIEFNGSSYIAIVDHKAGPSNVPPDDITTWDLVASSGAMGMSGANSTVPGPTGPQGEAGADSIVAATIAGPLGALGITGAAGTQGLQVPSGPQGPAGDQHILPFVGVQFSTNPATVGGGLAQVSISVSLRGSHRHNLLGHHYCQ
jgi:hypothetical protein